MKDIENKFLIKLEAAIKDRYSFLSFIVTKLSPIDSYYERYKIDILMYSRVIAYIDFYHKLQKYGYIRFKAEKQPMYDDYDFVIKCHYNSDNDEAIIEVLLNEIYYCL